MSRHGWPLIVLLCGWLAASSGCTSARSVARKLAPDSKRDFEMRLTMAQVHEQEGKLPKAAAVYAALENKVSSDRDRHTIDRLDRAFFLISQLESAVRSELIRAEDVLHDLGSYQAPHRRRSAFLARSRHPIRRRR
jgi:hypothetical protein